MARYDPLTLAGVIEQMAAEKPDCLVLTIEGAGVRADETRTYAQLWDRGQRLAAGLQSLNLQPGEKLGTLLANHVELVDLMLACSLLGAVLVLGLMLGGHVAFYLKALHGGDARGSIAFAADTLLRDLARLPAAEPATPRVLGVDDWALCKSPVPGAECPCGKC